MSLGHVTQLQVKDTLVRSVVMEQYDFPVSKDEMRRDYDRLNKWVVSAKGFKRSKRTIDLILSAMKTLEDLITSRSREITAGTMKDINASYNREIERQEQLEERLSMTMHKATRRELMKRIRASKQRCRELDALREQTTESQLLTA